MTTMNKMVDPRGTELKAGQRVAFNLSGTIALGVIESVPPEDTRPWGKANIKVRLLHQARTAGQHTGHVSTLRNPQNLLVLHHDDLPVGMPARSNAGWVD